MSDKLPKSVQFVKGVGPKRAERLAQLDIYTVEDLLYYFPRDYEDRRKIVKISNLKPDQKVNIKGQVLKKINKKIRKGLSILRITLSDSTGTVEAVWFNQPYLQKKLKQDRWYFMSGTVDKKSWRQYQKIQINNPVFEEVNSEENIHTGRVVPVYSLTEGISQKKLRQIIYNALNDYAIHLDDILPESVKNKYRFTDYPQSLWGLHFPENRAHYLKARRRLAFEELFLLQLLMLERKQGNIKLKGIKHQPPGLILNEFLSSLPFSLTGAQQRVWQEIKQNMESEIPMQRLLQGDVGAGKTIVAILALIETIANGYQGVIMAPTEILAEQHFLKAEELLTPLKFKVALLTGSMKQSQRSEIEQKIAENKIDLIVGTHALFQEGLSYHKVGLVIIDEQHRFGVEQRHRLKTKGDNPDLLVMTATPIPRSLALTFYGDLDLSLIDELPPGRRPVVTRWIIKKSRSKIYDFLKEKLNKGRQAFVVCPLIEPSEEIDAVSAEELKKELVYTLLEGFEVGILHSKLGSDRKQETMLKFRRGELDVLVSTTVIEVGVDVSNASVMIIENAERFGLAQLHQLRGRVGRGNHQSYCIIIGNPSTAEGKKRLKVFTETNDGFKIAEEDLKIRGPGEFFGTRQHGIPDLKVASLLKDRKLLKHARSQASQIISRNAWEKEFPELKERLENMEMKV